MELCSRSCGKDAICGQSKEAISGSNGDFKRAFGSFPSSLLMARSSVAGSLRSSPPLCSDIVSRSGSKQHVGLQVCPGRLQDPGSQGAGKPGSVRWRPVRSEISQLSPHRGRRVVMPAGPVLTTHREALDVKLHNVAIFQDVITMDHLPFILF
jgi:hypothetical protein